MTVLKIIFAVLALVFCVIGAVAIVVLIELLAHGRNVSIQVDIDDEGETL